MVFLLLLTVAGAVWILNVSSATFLTGFARLLDGGRVEGGALGFLTGRLRLTGRLADREVVVRLQLKRGRHSVGWLSVAVRTSVDLPAAGSAVEARVRDDDGRRALFDLASRDLLLGGDGGWLTARWQPQGFVFFPGRFVEARWRPVLDAMCRVAASIERA